MSVSHPEIEAAGATGLMRAIVATNGMLTMCTLASREPGIADVLIRVRAVGLCRTDLLAVAGDIPVPSRLIPGHEFSGTVAYAGALVNHVTQGDRVAINPVLSCGACVACGQQARHECPDTRLLGVDLDGACAEFVVMPGYAVYPVPDWLSFEAAAFAEPVAASLAVLKAEIYPDQRGLIVGENRIAQLTCRVLAAHGFSNIAVCAEDDAHQLSTSSFDFIIETCLSTSLLSHIIRALRPRGRIVLKSRQFQPVGLTLHEILPKEPVLQAVHYGRFDEAVALLAAGRVSVDDLVGSRFEFDRFSEAFADARCGERLKTFLIFEKA